MMGKKIDAELNSSVTEKSDKETRTWVCLYLILEMLFAFDFCYSVLLLNSYNFFFPEKYRRVNPRLSG